MWLLFWIANIVDNIIWNPTSGIRTKVRVKAMAEKEVMAGEEGMFGEKGKASGIENFDGTDFRY